MGRSVLGGFPFASSPRYPWDYLGTLCPWARGHPRATRWLSEEGRTVQLSSPSYPLQNVGAETVPRPPPLLAVWLQFPVTVRPVLPAAVKRWIAPSGSARASHEAHGKRVPAGKGTGSREPPPALPPRGYGTGRTAAGAELVLRAHSPPISGLCNVACNGLLMNYET